MNLISLPPPRRILQGNLLPILEKVKNLYKIWIPIFRNMPKTERSGLGAKIDILLLEILEKLRESIYSNKQQKVSLLNEVNILLDSLRFFLQLSWEIKIISHKKYILIGKEAEEIGKLIGLFRKSFQKKTPAQKTRERLE